MNIQFVPKSHLRIYLNLTPPLSSSPNQAFSNIMLYAKEMYMLLLFEVGYASVSIKRVHSTHANAME